MFFVYFALWILLNARVTGDVLLSGAAVCALVYLFTWKVAGLTPAREWKAIRGLPFYARYFAYLVSEIVKANLQVLGLIFTAKYEVEPRLVRLKTALKTDAARVLLANSITLTPGTITAELDGDELVVHALDASTAEGLEENGFEKRLSKWEAEKQ